MIGLGFDGTSGDTHSGQISPCGGLMASVGFGFLPAFRDLETGETHLSTNVDGTISPIHLIDGLPSDWVAEHDELGRPIELRHGVTPGFVRDGRFFELAELLHVPPMDA